MMSDNGNEIDIGINDVTIKQEPEPVYPLEEDSTAEITPATWRATEGSWNSEESEVDDDDDDVKMKVEMYSEDDDQEEDSRDRDYTINDEDDESEKEKNKIWNENDESEEEKKKAKRKRNAECQRAFRLRQKIKKETEATEPQKEMSQDKIEAKRKRNTESQRRYRQRKKQKEETTPTEPQEEMSQDKIEAKRRIKAEIQRRYRQRRKQIKEETGFSESEEEMSQDKIDAKRKQNAEYKRRYRQRQKQMKEETEPNEPEEEMSQDKIEAKRKRNTEHQRRYRQRLKERRSKEESAEKLQQDKIKAQRQRQKLRESNTEAELEAIRQRKLESKRLYRLRQKQKREELGTEECKTKIEAHREKWREKYRLKVAQERATPEQIAERNRELAQKRKIRQLTKRATMTEVQLKEKRDGQYLAYLQKKANKMPPKKKRDAERSRISKLSEEEKAKMRIYGKNIYTEDQYQKHLQKMKEYHLRKTQMIKQDPKKWDELKQKFKERYKKNRIKLLKAKAEGKEIPKRKKYKRKNPTPTTTISITTANGQVVEVNKARLCKANYSRNKRAQETPEEREKRLRQMKLNWAKRGLRRRLTAGGASQEQIEMELKELEATFQPSTRRIAGRPRPDLRNHFVDLVLASILQPEPLAAACESSETPEVAPFIPIQSASILLQNFEGYEQEKYAGNSEYDCETGVKLTNLESNEDDVSFPVSPPSPPPSTTSSEDHSKVHVPDYFQGDEEYDASYPIFQPSSPNPPFPQPPATHENDSQVNVSASVSDPLPEVDGTTFIPKRKGPGRPRHSNKRSPQKKLTVNPEYTTICNICGKWMHANSMSWHIKLLHHPHFTVDFKCDLCPEQAEPFKTCRQFYFKHWRPVHEKEEQTSKEETKPFICDVCGANFKGKRGLDFHKINKHEDRPPLKCLHCDKMFTGFLSINSHMKRFHPNVERHPCLRCDKLFPSQPELKEHVKEEHPSSYFPCEECGALKYTLSTKLHHYRNCQKKLASTDKETLLKEVKNGGIHKLPAKCEICDKSYILSSIHNHYRNVHGLIEERFSCWHCERTFKTRDYWAGHMEMVHAVDLDDEEVKDKIRKYNVADRSKVVIKNVPGSKPSKNKKPPSRTTKTKKTEPKIEEDAEESEGQSSEDEGTNEDDNDNGSNIVIRRSSSRKRKQVNYLEDYSNIEKEKKLVINMVPLTPSEINKWVIKTENISLEGLG